MSIRAFRLAVALSALPLLAAPAVAETMEDEQVWMNLTVMGTVGRFAYMAEVQPRFAEDASHLRQLLLRPAIGLKLSPHLTVYQGYVRVELPRPGPDRHEDRSFQQISWLIGKVGGGALSSRTRFEQRWLSNGNDTGWRARELVRWSRPLGSPKQPHLLLSLEPFVAFNDTDWGARAGFDQLRSFGGLEIPVRGKSTIEVGYLNQLINDPGGNKRMNHVASVALFIRP